MHGAAMFSKAFVREELKTNAKRGAIIFNALKKTDCALRNIGTIYLNFPNRKIDLTLFFTRFVHHGDMSSLVKQHYYVLTIYC